MTQPAPIDLVAMVVDAFPTLAAVLAVGGG